MTIPLGRLPAPAAVVAEEFEQLRDDAVADLVARLAAQNPPVNYVPRATDPAVRLIEVAAYIRLLLGGRINDAVRGTFLALATGTDLDNVVAALNVVRLAGETNDALRGRARLAWDALSTAGPTDGYRFHALSVPGVRDAHVTSPDPGEVTVSVLSHAGGGVADAALLAAVTAALGAEAVRPVTDVVTVQAVAAVAYDVTATLTLTGSGPDSAVVVAAAEAAVREYVDDITIGRDIRRSQLFAACHVPGVESVALAAPAADVAVDDAEFGLVGAVAVTVA